MSKEGTDNSKERLKLQVREWLGAQIPEWRVLDLYCGQHGRMYSGIWHRATEYFGVDKFRPHSLANTAMMSAERASQQLDLDGYTIFDVDCYGTPWKVTRTIIKRRGAGRFGMALTSGEFRGLHDGATSEITRAMIGARGLSRYHLMYRYHDLILRLCVRSLAEMPGVTLIKAAVSETSSHIVYLGLVLDKQSV